MAPALRWLPWVVLAAGSLATAQADDVATLHHNPFQRPALPTPTAAHGARMMGPGGADGLELRATLIGPEHAMADVNGIILSVGEKVEGFRLLEVGERQAVLERDGTRVVVSLEDAE